MKFKLTIAVLVVVTAISTVATYAASVYVPTGPAQLSDKVAISYCVIRVDSSKLSGFGGPSVDIRFNDAHSCIGVTDVERTTEGNLRITHDAGGAIGACIAKEDETLVRLNIQTGCSGGAGITSVVFYRAGKHVRIQDINSDLANVWMLWVADPLPLG